MCGSYTAWPWVLVFISILVSTLDLQDHPARRACSGQILGWRRCWSASPTEVDGPGWCWSNCSGIVRDARMAWGSGLGAWPEGRRGPHHRIEMRRQEAGRASMRGLLPPVVLIGVAHPNSNRPSRIFPIQQIPVLLVGSGSQAHTPGGGRRLQHPAHVCALCPLCYGLCRCHVGDHEPLQYRLPLILSVRGGGGGVGYGNLS